MVGSAVGQTAAGGFSTPAKPLDTLRQMPAQQIADLASRVVASRYKSFDPNGSVIDGWLLPQSPAKAFASGRIQKVDLLAGLNGRELSAFRIGAAAAAKQSAQPAQKSSPTDAVKKLAEVAQPLYGAWTGTAVAAYLVQIVLHGDIAVDHAGNDMLMACPVGAEITLEQSAGGRTFLYRFDRSVPGQGAAALGAFHGLEIPYVFNTFTVRGWRWLPFTETDRKLSATIETYWTNFARFGDPNSAGLPTWKPWNGNEEPYLEFTAGGEPVPQRNFSPPFCRLAPQGLKERLLE